MADSWTLLGTVALGAPIGWTACRTGAFTPASSALVLVASLFLLLAAVSVTSFSAGMAAQVGFFAGLGSKFLFDLALDEQSHT